MDNLFGVKLATIVAGFVGAVVSLSAIPPLSKGAAFLAVITGMATAVYLTPVVAHYLSMTSEMQNAAAFFLGLTAMHIIPGLLAVGQRFRDDPFSILRRPGGGDK